MIDLRIDRQPCSDLICSSTASPPWSATGDRVMQAPGLDYPGLASAGKSD